MAWRRGGVEEGGWEDVGFKGVGCGGEEEGGAVWGPGGFMFSLLLHWRVIVGLGMDVGCWIFTIGGS